MKTLISSLFAILMLSCAASAAQPKKPNILFIVADDRGYADVGFHGCRDIPTPNVDALAASGVRFTSGYVSGPYCSPTRAGLMTGRYQTRFGHEFNPGGNGGLPLSETTIANRLKTAGYVTGLVGKWHLGSLPQFHPQKRGFDEFFGFLGGSHDYFRSAGILRGEEQVLIKNRRPEKPSESRFPRQTGQPPRPTIPASSSRAPIRCYWGGLEQIARTRLCLFRNAGGGVGHGILRRGRRNLGGRLCRNLVPSPWTGPSRETTATNPRSHPPGQFLP